MSSVIAMREMEKVMEAYAKSYAETQIEILCGHYNIDFDEAKGLMKKKRRKGTKGQRRSCGKSYAGTQTKGERGTETKAHRIAGTEPTHQSSKFEGE